MKEMIQCAAVLAVSLALIPCLVFMGVKGGTREGLTVGVYFNASGEVKEYTEDEYLTGAVLAQMPADLSEEALKAQAVLARTYIYRRYEDESEEPTPSLHGALISDDDSVYQSFFTEEQAKGFYGEDWDKARKKVEKAVRDAPCILTYNGEPITAAYHAASSGSTESALTAWGQDIPYLRAVDSSSDAKLAGIESKTEMGSDDFSKKMEEQLGVKLTGDPAKWVQTEVNERGYVTKLVLGGTEVNVQRFIAAAGVASPCFKCEVKEDTLCFTAKGYGHLVGMSQYGANSMAENGSTYKEILSHYFKGCKTEDIH